MNLVQPRRIGHVLPWPTIGGVERATSRIAAAIAGRGFESVAFCVGHRTPVSSALEAQGIETFDYEPIEPSLRRAHKFVADSLHLASVIRRSRVELLHCSDLLAAYHAALAGRLAGVPVICHIRCEYRDISRRDQQFLRAVQRFVFVSQQTREAFAFHVPARQARVIYDGIELAPDIAERSDRLAVRSQLGIPEGARVVGMVARVAPIKDYATLVRAAARLRGEVPDVYFLIVGDNDGAATYQRHFAEVRSMLVDAGVADRFVFTGFRSDIPRMMSAMDVVALVTHSEGLPLVLLEAMARAKPVVATAVGGIPEVVIDGSTGMLHQHQDDAQLAERLVSLLRSPALADRLGGSGQQFVREHFSVARFSSDLTDLYVEILRQP